MGGVMSRVKTQVDPKVLQFDSLSEAEKITGKDYTSDPMTSALGMLLHIDNAEREVEMLAGSDDTTLSNELDNYVRIVEDEGFQLVLTVPFTTSRSKSAESLFVYWHPEGILLRFDTYESARVNGGDFYYNWAPNENVDAYRFTSSGSFFDDEGEMVWSGNHDSRKALRYHISQLRSNGRFLPIWATQPFIWLLHYGDTEADGYDYKSINDERVDLLPDYVQKAISGRVES